MKNKKSLNLFNQNKTKLDKKQTENIKGGTSACGCGCYYPQYASTNDNACANADSYISSPYIEQQ